MTGLQLGSTLARIGGLFRPQLRCSFCGRPAGAVDRLVAGASAHICDACIEKCVAILEQHGGTPAAPNAD
jgi:ClpX C4-type zinc finger protein